jgi:CPA2 family monovalent cation:H+ antiporter-2
VKIDFALMELGVIMLTLAVLGRIATRFGVPTIPVFLLVGLFFGNGGVISVQEAQPFIEIGASLGVIFLLFMLGLEYTPQELKHSMKTNVFAGVLDGVANVIPGVVMGLVLGWGALGASVLGGITYVSSSGIIAKQLTDLGRLGNRETPLILSILVIEDLVMAVFLPVLAVALSGGSLLTGVISGLISASVVLAVLTFSPKLGGTLARILGGKSQEVVLLMLLGLATLVSGFAEFIHISYAIGAFLLGITISGQVAETARELLQPLRASFAALFFVYFGFEVVPSSLWNVALPAVVLAVASAATKLFSGWIAAKKSGLSSKGSWRAAVTLIPRGELSIVLAGIGVASGLNNELSSLVVAYVLILAIGGSLAIRFLK